MDDNNNSSSHYETINFKMSNGSQHSSQKNVAHNKKKNRNREPVEKLFYTLEPDGSKSFGAVTGVIIILILIFGIGISYVFKAQENYLGQLISIIVSLALVFGVILK